MSRRAGSAHMAPEWIEGDCGVGWVHYTVVLEVIQDGMSPKHICNPSILRLLRLQREWTYPTASRRAGVSERAIRHAEAGTAGLQTQVRLLLAYGLPESALWRFTFSAVHKLIIECLEGPMSWQALDTWKQLTQNRVQPSRSGVNDV